MANISVISPIKVPLDIQNFTSEVKCREFYVYYHKFINNNFEYIKEYINEAKKNNSKIYVNFKHSILEEELPQIKKFIEFLTTVDINGIFVNSYGILEIIKTMDLPFEVIIDSYFDIHNICGIEFMEMFHKIDKLIITEEVYLKNIEKIKKYAKIPLAIDSDNLPWFAEDLINSKAIEAVVIKGKFEESKDILSGIKLVEKILEKPKMFKNQKLPFKHVRKSFYKTNHFSGEMMSAEGNDFKFSNSIKKYDWQVNEIREDEQTDYSKCKLPHLNLRLASLAQIKELGKFIKKYGFNPVHSIEYGEVASTVDLASKSFEKIIMSVKTFCQKHDIELNLSTPRVLIERDFDRVYEANKMLILQDVKPKSIVVNNIGFWWALNNDEELQGFPVEIGGGINLLNSLAIKCLNNLNPIRAIDFSYLGGTPSVQDGKVQWDYENIEHCMKKIKKLIPVKKMFIGGCLRVESLGLCPLNCNSAVVSRLSCSAPCHKGHFCMKDPSLDKIYPFMVDGFCKMHMFEDLLVQDFEKIPYYQNIGINEFVIDFSAVHSPLLPKVLKNYLNVVSKF